MKNKSKEELGETPFNHLPTVVIAQRPPEGSRQLNH